ncbi:Heparan-sulfate 6-O-sulfotransferase 3 [Oryzias melastigma]|uniref:Heparan-sulfate 6-O-sulfotransferase n=1 Tax=Oryzias melastigma TaxID=30732 RepID=A0A834F832_ORYME|nr:Heparan-sulfate 6-O-sulfotransferase 3 [Oryzias melastigma]
MMTPPRHKELDLQTKLPYRLSQEGIRRSKRIEHNAYQRASWVPPGSDTAPRFAEQPDLDAGTAGMDPSRAAQELQHFLKNVSFKEDRRHHLRPAPGQKHPAGAALRLHARPEEVHLPPARQSRVVALLPVLHGLELRLARGLDRTHECVPGVMNKRDKKNAQKNKRNFYYITMLRDPVSRYLSEWKHVQRGATWKTALHMCDGRPPTQDELPACYSGEDWTGVSLTDFMNCPYNLANNRQVRMLADLSLVGCYNMSSMSELERGRVLLASAKVNLRNMAFYGLTEFQRKTQYLFESTFGLHFIRAFTQINSTRAASVGISEKVRWRIEGLNALDMELYEYAKELFLRRYQFNRQRQHQEERIRRRQERQRMHRTYLGQLWRLGGGGDMEEEEVKVPEEVATTEDYSSQVVRW